MEAASRINLPALNKHSPDRIKRRNAVVTFRKALHDRVQVPDHGAIEKPQNPVLVLHASWAPIFRDWQLCLFLHTQKRLVRSAQQLDVFKRDQIEAIAKVDYRTDYGGVLIVPPLRLLICPRHCAQRIRFPKICARPKPVVILVAIEDFRAVIHGFFSNSFIAPVIAEHE